MFAALTNHLWQSTFLAIVAALLTLAFRKNRAHVRYMLWLAASLKFLVPFALLIALGTNLWSVLATRSIPTVLVSPVVSQAIVQATQPIPDTLSFAPTAAHATNWLLISIVAVWALGFFAIALMRLRACLHIRSALKSSEPFEIRHSEGREVVRRTSLSFAVRSTPGLLEPGVEQMREMIRSLLADRFQLKVSHETKELPVFALVVAKGGPKITPSNDDGTNSGQDGHGDNDIETEKITNRPIDTLVQILTGQAEVEGRKVVNETGLTATYTYTLKWTRQRPLSTSANDLAQPTSEAPSLWDALETQLGLQLKSTKAPIDTIVITHIEKPTPNYGIARVSLTLCLFTTFACTLGQVREKNTCPPRP